VLNFLALFSSWATTATSLELGALCSMVRKGPCVSSCKCCGWRPASVAVTSSEGGAMEEAEESAFAAFDV
jgi:hypothetical protein